MPAILSLWRLLAVPPVLRFARDRAVRRCGSLMAIMVVIDLADGMIARRVGDEPALRVQRRLDGIADIALYAATPLSVYWARPELLRREWRGTGLLAAAQLASTCGCLLKFRRLPRYHTGLFRWSSGALGIAVAVRIGLDRLVWSSRVILGIATLAHLEALLITRSLDIYTEPVPSIWELTPRGRRSPIARLLRRHEPTRVTPRP